MTVQEAWVNNWLTTVVGMIFKDGNRWFVLHIVFSYASFFFYLLFPLSWWDSNKITLIFLCFFYLPAPSLCSQCKGEIFDARVWAQTTLISLAQLLCLLNKPLWLLVLSLAAFSHWCANILPSKIVLSRLVRYKRINGDSSVGVDKITRIIFSKKRLQISDIHEVLS